MTITGCLERTRPQPSSSPDTSETSATAFTLRAASEAGRDAVLYQVLPANDRVKLGDHVGHRVTVTAVIRAATNTQPGRSNEGVSPSMRSTGMDTQPTPAPREGALATAVTIAQPLVVNAVKMLSVRCDAGK